MPAPSVRIAAALAAASLVPALAAASASAHTGQRIVYSSLHQQLVTVDPDGSRPRQITHYHVPKGASQPRFAPNGRRVAFILGYFDPRRNEGRTRLCTMPSTGGKPHCLVNDARSPAYSPDGRWIAYVAPNDSIRMVPAAGGAVRRVTRGRRQNEDTPQFDNPQFSPDGQAIAYDEWTEQFQNVIAERDLTTGATRLLGGPGSTTETETPRFPDYSPDGSEVVYTVDSPSLAQDVFIAPRAGGPRQRLTRNRSTNIDPSWSPHFSPDGKHIVYWSGDAVGSFRVRVMDADGRHKHTIARGQDADWGAHVRW